MAESAIDKLKRLAREKKAAPVIVPVETQPTQPVVGTPEFTEAMTENSEANLEMRMGILNLKLRAASLQVDEDIKNVSENSTLETLSVESGEVIEPIGGSGSDTCKQLEVYSQQGEGDRSTAQSTIQLEDASLNITTGKLCADPAVLEQINTAYETLNLTTGELTPTPSNHPLAMEFAELEAALLAADPDFRNQLRNVHRHLGKEPELVTMMSEQEIQMIVRGLVELANSEIVEPAKAKSVKKATADMKKKVISADDL